MLASLDTTRRCAAESSHSRIRRQRDTGYPGLTLRVSHGGRKAWSMLYRLKGEKTLRHLQLGIVPVLTLAEAREAWREARKALMAGTLTLPPLPSL